MSRDGHFQLTLENVDSVKMHSRSLPHIERKQNTTTVPRYTQSNAQLCERLEFALKMDFNLRKRNSYGLQTR